MKDTEHNEQVGLSGYASSVTRGVASGGLRLVLRRDEAEISIARAVQAGILLDCVLVENRDGELATLLGAAGVREVEVPAKKSARQKFLAKWSAEARRKAKNGVGMSLLLLPLAACGGDDGSSGGGSTGGGSTVSKTTGFVIDGYIENGFIFRDENGNGLFDAGEANTRTGEMGAFTLGGDPTKPIIMDGSDGFAVDADNRDVPFTGILMAPAGATAVTPLTTLVQQLLEAGESVQDATSAVKC